MISCYIAKHFSDGIRITIDDPNQTAPNILAMCSNITCKFTNNTDIKIEDCYVQENKRKRGIFKAMLMKLEDYSKENNFNRIWGEVVSHPNGPDEEILKCIYKKLGFTIKDRIVEKVL